MKRIGKNERAWGFTDFPAKPPNPPNLPDPGAGVAKPAKAAAKPPTLRFMAWGSRPSDIVFDASIRYLPVWDVVKEVYNRNGKLSETVHARGLMLLEASWTILELENGLDDEIYGDISFADGG